MNKFHLMEFFDHDFSVIFNIVVDRILYRVIWQIYKKKIEHHTM